MMILKSFPWPDLFTGVNIYPMLIVFRAEHAACLKHSSLFKVKNINKDFVEISGFLPSLVGRDPKKGVFPFGRFNPQTQLRAGGEHPRKYILVYDFLPLPCI
jgi:hypothetical protein